MKTQSTTLFELNSRVKETLKRGFPESLWVTAEITEIQLNRSGHCYLQLAEKKKDDESIIATARAVIWAFTFRTLKPYFESVTGRPLARGMQVLLKVEVVFHELYGYSLNVRDIDPNYTLGDLERKKQEIIDQLKKDGIYDMNRSLEFPILPKNIAVISSPTAAGYGDFINQLINNVYGYKFHIHLFPAVMQGERTTESVIAALDRINEYESLFDVVVIIRGGGSQTDLGSFDSYEIGENIAQFPLPVITGIGHERDNTIADEVACKSLKTPTAVAAFLIDAFHEQEVSLQNMMSDFIEGVRDLMADEAERQYRAVSDFKHLTNAVITKNKTALTMASNNIEFASQNYIKSRMNEFSKIVLRMQNHTAITMVRENNSCDKIKLDITQKVKDLFSENHRKLALAETTMKLVDPRRVLARGYSITRVDGKAVKEVKNLKSGILLETQLSDGIVQSIVVKD